MNVDFTDKIKYDGESQTVRPVRPGKEVTMAFYRLVTDSCCELVPALKTRLHAAQAPLTMLLDGVSYTDDETLDRDRFLAAMKASRSAPKSACPSPDCYARLFSGEGDVFAVTISSKLSGSYNSAQIGRTLALAVRPNQKIHVFDSCSASAGELAVSLRIAEYVQAGLGFDEIVSKTEAFIRGMRTFFIAESLDTLIKSGRMGRITGYVALAMSLRPIMTADHGEIKLYEKARGSVRAFTRLVDIIGECSADLSKRTLVVSHCHNERQAAFVAAEARRRYPFRDVVVVPTGGLSSMYVNSGGVIIAF